MRPSHLKSALLNSALLAFATILASTPALACGGGSEVTGFWGVAFLLIAGFFATQIALTRGTEAVLLDRSRPLLSATLSVLSLTSISVALIGAAILSDSRLATMGVLLFGAQILLLSRLVRAAWPAKLTSV